MPYTLSDEDFKNIHNSKCDVYSVIVKLDGVVASPLLEQLRKAYHGLNAGLQSVYAQEEEESATKEKHYASISSTNKFKTIWSLDEIADLTAEHPFKAAMTVLYKDHWGDTPVQAGILGNTWVDLWRAADQCIKLSGDNHHVFIEDFSISKDDPTTLILSTGS
jgi:hypothetical protein